MRPAGAVRGVFGFTTIPRAATTISRRTAASAGRSTDSTARWTGRDTRATKLPSPRPIMLQRTATMRSSGWRLRSMARAQSILFA